MLGALFPLFLFLSLSFPIALAQNATYQWGYIMRCQPYSIDFPCLIQVSGTATVSTTRRTSGTLTQTNSNGTATTFTAVPYYNVIAFTGTRTHTNKYGTVLPRRYHPPPLH